MNPLVPRHRGFFVVHHPDVRLCGTFIPVSGENGIVLGKGENTAIPEVFRGTRAGTSHAHVGLVDDQTVMTTQRTRIATYINGTASTHHALAIGDVVHIDSVVLVFANGHPHRRSEHYPGYGVSAGELNAQVLASQPQKDVLFICGRKGTSKDLVAQLVHGQKKDHGPLVAVDGEDFDANTFLEQCTVSASAPGQLAQRARHVSLYIRNADHCSATQCRSIADALPVVCLIFSRTHDADLAPEDTTIRIPRLHARREDILVWATFFSRATGFDNVRWTTALATRILGYSWPGNEAELHRFIARMCHEQGDSKPWDLSSDLTNRLSPCFQDAHRDRTEAQIEKEVLINSLRVHAGQLRLVADELSTTVETLKEQINLWNIDPAQFN